MIKYTDLKCAQCLKNIDNQVSQYSIENFGHPLCRNCQDWLRDIQEYTSATELSINLYFALKEREVPAQLEKSDGFKTIDIAVPHAKVNTEVDGLQHNYSSEQAMRDLQRTLYSFKKGYSTLRVPNALVKNDLDKAANLITEYLIVSRNSKKKSY